MSGGGMSYNHPMRKRDRLRGFLTKSARTPSAAASVGSHTSTSTAPGHGSVNQAATPSPAALSQPRTLSADFYAAALNKLEAEERSVIEKHVTPDLDDAIQAAYTAASKQKQICEAKRWPGSEQAAKVLLWLDRFKSVGDVVANADPVHVGLPWAGVRLLLEAAVADSHHMTALMGGMDLALCIANRLRAYLAYFQHLPPSLTTDNLRKALVDLYAHVLRLLAEAIRTYSRNIAARKFEAVWRKSDLVNFEDRCDQLGARVDIEANNCDRDLRAKNQVDTARWKHSLDTMLRKLDAIQSITESLGSLQVKVDLSKLTRIQEATYNSTAQEKLPLCLAGTRSEILTNITKWLARPEGDFIFWLCGKAGTGKTTISRTIAQRFDQQGLLAASFFFKRGEKNRSNADLFFSTIAAQLADLLPRMQFTLAAALEQDSFLCGRGLQEQFEKLLLQPILSVDPAHLPQHSVALVIDALDECDRNTDIRKFLQLLTRLKTETTLRLRIFITSRPELPIQLGFRRLDKSLHQDIILEEIQEDTIQRDLRTYFDDQFTKIKEDRLLLRSDDPLPADWPSNNDIHTLVDLAVPLFIFASTVCRFVADSNPRKRLKVLLEQRYSVGSSQLAQMYLPILNQLLCEDGEPARKEKLAEFREVIGPIVLAADPLSVVSLVKLLGVDQENIRDVLERLHSVLQVPSNLHEPVRLLHLSFRDFLTDSSRKDETFWIPEAETHKQLAYHCLRRLQEPGTLKSDMCCVGQPGFHRVGLTARAIALHIPADVAYACSHWSWHLTRGGEQLYDNGQVHHFLQKHFLHWLETLSWTGRLRSAINCVDDLLLNAQGKDCCEMAAFLADAKRFILSHRLAIDVAPLQLYHSALIFSPRKSIVRDKFHGQHPNAWDLLPSVPVHWGAELLHLRGHTGAVNAMAFSSNGQVLASASTDDGTLRLWDAQSGEEKHKIPTSDVVETIAFSANDQVVGVASMAYLLFQRFWNVETGEQLWDTGRPSDREAIVACSPDGQIVATSKDSWAVQLFDARTSKQTHCLEGHMSLVTALAFSLDSQYLATGSGNGVIQLWDVRSGVRIHKLGGHGVSVTGLTFGPAGSVGPVVASILGDGTVQLWNAQTGEQTHQLEEQDGSAAAIAFTHDGEVVASTLNDQTVRLWNVQTGKQMCKIGTHKQEEPHSAPVIDLSPIERVMAIAMHDGPLELWSTQTGKQMQKLTGRNGDPITAVAFSPDGKIIASIGSGGTVQLWNSQTGEQAQGLTGHNENIMKATFSPDSQMVLAVSHHHEVRLWNVETGEPMSQLSESDEWFVTAAFVLNGEVIMTMEVGHSSICLWSVRTGQRISEVKLWDGKVSAVDFLPNSQALAVGLVDGTIRLWNVNGSERIQRCPGHDRKVVAIASSPDGQVTATASFDGKVRLWNVQTGEQMAEFVWDKEIANKLDPSSTPVMTFSPDSRLLAVSSWQKVQLWDTQMGKETRRLTLPAAVTQALAFSPDGQVLAVSCDSTLQLWQTQTGQQLSEPQAHSSSLLAVAFSRDGRLGTASWDHSVRLWSIQHSRERREKHSLGGHGDLVTAVVFSPDGRMVASSSLDETLRLWDPQTGSEIQKFQGHRFSISTAIFSPDGTMIAGPAYGGTVQLWDIRMSERTLRFEGHDERVSTMAFSSDGEMMISGSWDQTVRVWNVRSGEQMEMLTEHDVVLAVAISPNGQIGASACRNGKLRLWKIGRKKKVHAIQTLSFHADEASLTFSSDSQRVALATDTAYEREVRVWDVHTGGHMQTISLSQQPRPERPESRGSVSSEDSDMTSDRIGRPSKFSRDGKYLHTEIGTFILAWTISGLLEAPLERVSGIELAGPWIRYQRSDLLYLPFEYQGRCTAIHGNTLVIGQTSGAVTFFRLSLPDEDGAGRVHGIANTT